MARPPKSTATSVPRQPTRYANRNFGVAASPQTAAANLQSLGPTPPPTRNDGVIDLADIIGASAVTAIQNIGEIRFHALGDSGVGHADEAEAVANEMATDYRHGADTLNPAFLFHLGDVVYGPGKDDHYGERFYRPYNGYPGKILAIPGNHDGEEKSAADTPSLKAFKANFCTDPPMLSHQASGSGLDRETMNQPGVYWMLDAPFVRIVGLYSNRLENTGFLQGRTATGTVDNSQETWLTATLRGIAGQPKKALIIATHHPPYSLAGHAGNPTMTNDIDQACTGANTWPDAFLFRPRPQLSTALASRCRQQADSLFCGRHGRHARPARPTGHRRADRRDEWRHLRKGFRIARLYVRHGIAGGIEGGVLGVGRGAREPVQHGDGRSRQAYPGDCLSRADHVDRSVGRWSDRTAHRHGTGSSTYRQCLRAPFTARTVGAYVSLPSATAPVRV